MSTDAATPDELLLSSLLERVHECTPTHDDMSTPVKDTSVNFRNLTSWVEAQTTPNSKQKGGNSQTTVGLPSVANHLRQTTPQSAYVPLVQPSPTTTPSRAPGTAFTPVRPQMHTPPHMSEGIVLFPVPASPFREVSPMVGGRASNQTTPVQAQRPAPFQPQSHLRSPGNQHTPVRAPVPAGSRSSPDMTLTATSNYPTPTQNKLTVEQLRGRVYEMARDQHGCRHLQRLLDSEAAEYGELILSELNRHIPDLMEDQFANFLVQKLFEIMPVGCRRDVIMLSGPRLADVALTQHGTFSVQRLIETSQTTEERQLIEGALFDDIARMVNNANAAHVVVKILQRFEPPHRDFVFDALARDCMLVATDKLGCCNLKRCFDHATGDQRKRIGLAIAANALKLAQHEFGNYALQKVIELHDPLISDEIARQFAHNLIPLSVDKFSSNCVEKIFGECTNEGRVILARTMIRTNAVPVLVKDRYGNYVMQTALQVVPSPVRQELGEVVRQYLPLVQGLQWGKRLEMRVDEAIRGRPSSQPRLSPTQVAMPGHGGSPQQFRGGAHQQPQQQHGHLVHGMGQSPHHALHRPHAQHGMQPQQFSPMHHGGHHPHHHQQQQQQASPYHPVHGMAMHQPQPQPQHQGLPPGLGFLPDAPLEFDSMINEIRQNSRESSPIARK